MSTFVNLSNHPSKGWPEAQILAAETYGEIIDMPFPTIPVNYSSAQLDDLVDQYRRKILTLEHPTVMLQGEFVFTYRLVTALQKDGISCISACTERIAVENANSDGSVSKKSVFRFTGFRPY